MAFVPDDDDDRRFSLLLLEPGEKYFEDFSVHYFPPGCIDRDLIQRPIKGRLLICSNSILFEPSDPVDPIIKFPLRKCKKIGRWEPGLMSPMTSETCSIQTKQYVKLKEGNLVKPFVFIDLDKVEEFRFCPNYNPLKVVLSKAVRLFDAHTKHSRDRLQIIERITDEHRGNSEFNTSWLEDLSEKILLKVDAERVTPMVANPGRVALTDSVIYFQPFNNVEAELVQKYQLSRVIRIVKRRYLLQQVGVEVYFENDAVVFFALHDETQRNDFFDKLMAQTPPQTRTENQRNMMLMWQKGELSNYEYLMYLNRMADRSLNDLTQYPVFPWVIADYTSETLDLKNPATFRDLSKPIGALNESRLNNFKQRYEEMPSPKFLYGTHYSSPGYVLFYTLRVAPEYTLCLQNGKYDHADRMFRSIADTWNNVITDSADVKELIPEFYESNGDFLCNKQRLDFGTTQSTAGREGEKVGDVKLPPWAKDARDFTTKCREALECEYVSSRIHEWIDLIFGYKQRGPEAVASDNVFYYITYEGAVDLTQVTDPAEKEALQAQIMEFGQTPKQLFTIPHPARRLDELNDSVASLNLDTADTELLRSLSPTSPSPTEGLPSNVATPITNATSSKQMILGDAKDMKIDEFMKLHKTGIKDLCLSHDGKTLFSVSEDGLLKTLSLAEMRQTHSSPVGNTALSAVLTTDDPNLVVVGSWDNNVYWYSLEYARPVATLEAHDDAVSAVARAGNMLITASWDGTVKVWDYAKASSGARRVDEPLIAELIDLEGEVCCMAVDGTHRLIAAAAVDGQIAIWSLDDHELIINIEAHDDSVNAIAITPDGQRILSTSGDSTLKVFSISTGDEILSFDVGSEICSMLTDGHLVLGGCADGSVVVWDIVLGKQLECHTQHTEPVRKLLLTKECGRLISGSEDKHVGFWKC